MDPAPNKNGSWSETASTPKFGSVRPPGGKEGEIMDPATNKKGSWPEAKEPF
jgi:hypothetical protein